MVGSLFSNRPRVTGSNCKTSCFACEDFSADDFSLLTGLLCGALTIGSGLLKASIGSTRGGGGVSLGACPSNGVISIGWEASIGSGSMLIFGEISWGCSQTGSIVGALFCAGRVCCGI